MNESKKLYTVLIAIFVVVAIVITAVVVDNAKGEKYIKQIDNAFASKEAKLVYLGRPTCGYCTLLKPFLDNYAKKYKFSYEYINTDEVGNARLDKILNKLGQDSSSFGTPYLAVVKDGKKIAEQNGYVAENVLFDFLKENGFIDKDETLALNYIDYAGYKDLLEKKEKQIFVAVQTGCSHCEDAKPVLEELAKEYDLPISIINIAAFKDDAEKEEFMKSLPYYNENEWGTPLMLVVENKEVKANKNGFVSKEDYITFFKENGLIKE